MKKKYTLLAIFLLVCLFFTACSFGNISFDTDTSSIALKANGKWQSLLVEDYDKRILNIDDKELKNFVEKEVSEFNKNSHDVKLLKVKVDDTKVKLLFEYSSFEKLIEYANYSNDDTINFHKAEFFDVKDFKNSSYAGDLKEDIGEGKKVLVLEGIGSFYAPNKIKKALSLGQGNLEIQDKLVNINPAQNEKHTDVKTVIVIE
jgi:lipoprotein